MKFDQLKKQYFEKYDNESYKGDNGFQNVLSMLNKAENLSDKAKDEFVNAFKVSFEFALDGELYLGGKKSAASKYPNLMNEGDLVGIKIITR